MDGFPRSANTFAFGAFISAQTHSIRVSHHVHAPAQFRIAARRRIPTLLLIRKPSDAAVSHVQYLPFLTVSRALREWIEFHRRVQPVKDELLVATFDDVVRDFGAVTRALNARFATDFGVFEHTEANVAQVMEWNEQWERSFYSAETFDSRVGRPSPARDAGRAELRSQLESIDARRLLDEANSLYSELTAGTASRSRDSAAE